MFYRSSTIIISFVHQLTNSCDVSNYRNWSQLNYELFFDGLLELSSALTDEDHDHEQHDDDDDEHHDDHGHNGHDAHNDDDDEHAEKYFTQGQLEHLLRRIAVSYQPGRSAAPHSSPPEQLLDFVCSFGNMKVCLLITMLIYVLIVILKLD